MTERQRSPLRHTVTGLSLGSLAIALYSLLVVAVFHYLPFGLALFSTGFGGFLGMMFVFFKLGSHPAYGLLLVPIGIFGGWNAADWLRLEGGDIVSGIAMADTQHRPETVGYRWSDARVLTDQTHHILGPKARGAGKGRGAYIVAPIVGDGWTPQETITVFAICGAKASSVRTNHCVKGWGAREHMGEVVITDTAHYLDAVNRVRQETALHVAETPILVRWIQSIDDNRRKYKNRALWLFSGFLVFWNLANIRAYWRVKSA